MSQLTNTLPTLLTLNYFGSRVYLQQATLMVDSDLNPTKFAYSFKRSIWYYVFLFDIVSNEVKTV